MDDALAMAKESFETATSTAALQAALGRFLQAQGVEQYAYFTYDAGPRRRNPVLISNYAPDWLDHYMANAYARDDPVFRKADGALLPFASALPHREFLKVAAELKDALLVVAAYFHGHATRLTTQRQRAAVSLTEREYEILYACVCGYDADQIAERLDISVATVRVHFRNINEKYRVRSIRNACLIATANLDIDLPARDLMGVRTDLT